MVYYSNILLVISKGVMICVNCGSETKNPKFCSKSCAARYNNEKYPKRKKEGSCKKCQSPCAASRKFCHNCKNNTSILTVSDLIYKRGHRSNAFGVIRGRARNVAKKLGMNSCKICGYNKHIEIAHLKSIASFNEDEKISVVNDKSNLVPLCPNCHWEYDNGLINLSGG